MKVSIISAIFATLLAATSAAPVDTSCQSRVDALHQFQIDSLLHFDGNVIVLFFVTTGKDFSMEFQADGNILPITNPPPVSEIQVLGPAQANCTFFTIDKIIANVVTGQATSVVPPQTLAFGGCKPL